MAENDRLRREKNLLEVQWEEEVKRSDSAKSAMDGLSSKVDSLTSIMEIDKTLLRKRERKLEEMKTELETERQRRERAENETKATRRERDEAVEGLKKELHVATEQSKRATTQYDVISRSYKTLEESYSRQTRKLKTEMQSLRDDIVADHKKLACIQTIMEHHRSESQRSQEARDQLKQMFDAYKSEAEQEMNIIREAAKRNAHAHDRKQQEMQEAVNEMRYVVNVKKNVRGLE